MRRIRPQWATAIVFGLALATLAQTPTKPKVTPKASEKAPAKKKTSTAKKKSSSPTKSATRKTTPSKTSKATSKTRKASAPRGQMRPTAERYKEIEQALAARGYLMEEPSGKWGPASVDALRNFQADNELPATGKLDAQSLIQLGLGPKR